MIYQEYRLLIEEFQHDFEGKYNPKQLQWLWLRVECLNYHELKESLENIAVTSIRFPRVGEIVQNLQEKINAAIKSDQEKKLSEIGMCPRCFNSGMVSAILKNDKNGRVYAFMCNCKAAEIRRLSPANFVRWEDWHRETMIPVNVIMIARIAEHKKNAGDEHAREILKNSEKGEGVKNLISDLVNRSPVVKEEIINDIKPV